MDATVTVGTGEALAGGRMRWRDLGPGVWALTLEAVWRLNREHDRPLEDAFAALFAPPLVVVVHASDGSEIEIPIAGEFVGPLWWLTPQPFVLEPQPPTDASIVALTLRNSAGVNVAATTLAEPCRMAGSFMGLDRLTWPAFELRVEP